MKKAARNTLLIFLIVLILATSGLSPLFAEVNNMQQGQLLMEQGNYEEALEYFKAAMKNKADTQQAYFKGAECYYELGEYSMAISFANIGILENPDKAPASIYLIKGLSLLQYKKYQEALLVMIKAAEKEPNNAYIQYTKGATLSLLKRFDEAVACYDLAIANDPTVPDFYSAKAASLSLINKDEEAVKTIDAVLKIQAVQESKVYEAQMHHIKGKALYNLEKYKEALEEFLKADEISVFTSNQLFIGRTLSYLGEYDKAQEIFDYYVKNQPNNAEAFSGYGVVLNNMQSYDKALIILDKAIQLNPESYEAYINKGLSLTASKNYKDSVLFFDKAIQLNPSLPKAYVCKGFAYYQQNKYEQAIKSYDDAIIKKIADKQIYSDKAVILNELNRYAEAIQLFDKALGLDKNYMIALIGKSFSLTGLKKYNEAIALADSIIKADPEYVFPYISKGKALAGLKKYKEAIASIDNAIKLDARTPEAYFEKGNIQIAQGDLEGAINSFEKAIAFDLNKKYVDARKAAVDALAKKNKGLSLKTSTVIKIGSTEKLAVTTLPGYSAKMQLSWSSADAKIAKVDKTGVVTAVAPGETTIYAMSSDKKVKLFCKVFVTK